MTSSVPTLRIAVLGAGKIGSTFAFQLARTGGHDVTVIARLGSDRHQQLERHGGIANVNGERAIVEVASTLDEKLAYDLVRGGGASWAEALVLARGVRASFDLISALGYDIYPITKKRIGRSPAPLIAATLWGISRIRSFRELLATGEAECCALVDAMVAASPHAKHAVATSVIQAMKPRSYATKAPL